MRGESHADEGHRTGTEQEPDTETMELLTLTEDHPAVMLTLLVRTSLWKTHIHL